MCDCGRESGVKKWLFCPSQLIYVYEQLTVTKSAMSFGLVSPNDSILLLLFL